MKKTIMYLAAVATLSGCHNIADTSYNNPKQYVMTRPSNEVNSDLAIAAGVHSGSMDMVRMQDSCSVKGWFSSRDDYDSMEWARKRADVDGDGIVTRREAKNLLEDMCRDGSR